jgi:hypothetical protein
MKRFLLYILFILSSVPLFSQYKAIVELKKNSALSIFVETNVMNFSLVQKGDKLLTTPVEIFANVQHNKLDIDVKGFKSENPIGQKEFYKLMMVEKFPHMNIELIRFDASTDTSQHRSCGKAWLNITITNVTRKYEFPVIIQKEDGFMRIAGRKKISITDFGLTAPKNLLLGMVRVNEQIVIDLNLLCKLRLNNEDAAICTSSYLILQTFSTLFFCS